VTIQTFDEMIHAERGKLLRELPKDAQVFCSAGCSGRWYFDWIEQEYGPVALHYGVELFSPRPDDLPPNVRWISNSVADMTDVPGASVDILFSGQNIEHLYREDLHGFLKEANRVVKPGGHICLDSPNRTISQDASYTQPQHTLEFSVPEAVELVEAAGFAVEKVSGIWSCANGLKRFDDVTALVGDIEQRRAQALHRPGESFIWWIVARRIDDPRPDLPEIVDRILLRSFPSFVAARFRNAGRRLHSIEGTDAVLHIGSEEHGYVMYGPYIPLRGGEWQAIFDIKFLSPAGSVTFDVVSAAGGSVHAELPVSPSAIGSWQSIVLPFDLGDYTEGVETRMITHGADAEIRFGVGIRRR